MALRFSQKEVESELRDCFKHGYIRDVAIISGIGETYLDRGINPNDEAASFTYRFLQVQCALDERDREQGELHWQKVCEFREMSKEAIFQSLCVVEEAARNDKESGDVTQAVMRGRSLYDQLHELNEQAAQVERHRQAVLAAINAERSTANGGNTRFNARHFAKGAVAKRK